PELVQGWLGEAKRACCLPSYREEEALYGCPAFVPSDERSYWTEPAQLHTWWGNNVTKPNRYSALRDDAGYTGADPRMKQRAAWCEEVVEQCDAVLQAAGAAPALVFASTCASAPASVTSEFPSARAGVRGAEAASGEDIEEESEAADFTEAEAAAAAEAADRDLALHLFETEGRRSSGRAPQPTQFFKPNQVEPSQLPHKAPFPKPRQSATKPPAATKPVSAASKPVTATIKPVTATSIAEAEEAERTADSDDESEKSAASANSASAGSASPDSDSSTDSADSGESGESGESGGSGGWEEVGETLVGAEAVAEEAADSDSAACGEAEAEVAGAEREETADSADSSDSEDAWAGGAVEIQAAEVAETEGRRVSARTGRGKRSRDVYGDFVDPAHLSRTAMFGKYYLSPNTTPKAPKVARTEEVFEGAEAVRVGGAGGAAEAAEAVAVAEVAEAEAAEAVSGTKRAAATRNEGQNQLPESGSKRLASASNRPPMRTIRTIRVQEVDPLVKPSSEGGTKSVFESNAMGLQSPNTRAHGDTSPDVWQLAGGLRGGLNYTEAAEAAVATTESRAAEVEVARSAGAAAATVGLATPTPTPASPLAQSGGSSAAAMSGTPPVWVPRSDSNSGSSSGTDKSSSVSSISVSISADRPPAKRPAAAAEQTPVKRLKPGGVFHSA
ncbi:hypothetical protein B484DRAFT_397327, partial [Ochromonadaceae sp. CCMP2298]